MAAPLAGVRASEGLPRSGRIQKRADFLLTYENGAKTHGRFVVVFVCGNARDQSRLGVTVTRKLGKAVARNKAKRWVREVYRRCRLGPLPAGKQIDIVVNVKPSAVDVPFREFAADLVRVLERAVSRSGAT